MKSLIIWAGLFLAIVGCQSNAVIQPVVSNVPASLDLKKVENAIKMGAIERKWVVKPM